MSEHYNGENRRRKFQWSNVQFTGKDVIQLGAILLSLVSMWFGLASKVEVLAISFTDFKEAATKWEDTQMKRVDKLENRVNHIEDTKKDK